MQERLKLSNGRTVLASLINYQFDVDGKREGIATVVCFDRLSTAYVNGESIDVPIFVVWTSYPSDRSEDYWECESGHYGLTWDNAIELMIAKFTDYGYGRNQDLHRLMRNAEPF